MCKDISPTAKAHFKMSFKYNHVPSNILDNDKMYIPRQSPRIIVTNGTSCLSLYSHVL